MNRVIQASESNVTDYYQLFVNRLAYTLQSRVPNSGKGRHWYYRPKDKRTKRYLALKRDTLRKHLEGVVTVGLYSTNPETQRCKWIAIDADYPAAVADLLRLQLELKSDGVQAAFEQSRRGGHLWIFGQTPLLATHCRIYISHLAERLRVPVRGAQNGEKETAKEGIEIFPKQDQVTGASFGNALRGPLGVHRACSTRYWFYDVACTLDEQLFYLKTLPKLTEEQLSRFVAALPAPPADERPRSEIPRGLRSAPGREFRILDYVGKKIRHGTNFYARCPSCAQSGRDRGGDNLSIRVADPRFYKCWAGCSKEEIRAAFGCPIRTRAAS